MLRHILDACLRDIAKSLGGCIDLAQGPRRLVHSRIECTRETRALRLGRERKYARSRVSNTCDGPCRSVTGNTETQMH